MELTYNTPIPPFTNSLAPPTRPLSPRPGPASPRPRTRRAAQVAAPQQQQQDGGGRSAVWWSCCAAEQVRAGRAGRHCAARWWESGAGTGVRARDGAEGAAAAADSREGWALRSAASLHRARCCCVALLCKTCSGVRRFLLDEDLVTGTCGEYHRRNLWGRPALLRLGQHWGFSLYPSASSGSRCCFTRISENCS